MQREFESFASVDLSLLEHRDEVATSTFVWQMQRRGIGVVRISSELHALHERCVEAASLYFETESIEKKFEAKMGLDGNRGMFLVVIRDGYLRN